MRYLPALLIASLTGCGPASSPPAAAPAHAEPIAHESELLKLTLTHEAQRRLGIRLVRVGNGSATAMRQAAGEIVVPPTSAGGIPTSSTSNLPQIASQQAIADGEVARTRAQARLARIALNRAEALVREEAGSVRARDEAATALAAADAAQQAALAQRRLLGPSTATMGNQPVLWVRVPVFGSDLRAITRGMAVTVRALGDQGTGRQARPVRAAPSANAVAGTVDLYYSLPNRDGVYRVGQRVAVDIPVSGSTGGLAIPSAAILRDIHGGEWVYQRTAKNMFVRQRVEVGSEADGQALVARGLTSGADIVTDGAAELFGTEFGAAH